MGCSTDTKTDFLGKASDDICNQITNDVSGSSTVAAAYASQVHGLTETYYYTPSISGLDVSDAEHFISLVIEDVCPTYRSGIPYGAPGAP